MVREAPQRSVTLMEPQAAPAAMHNSVSVSGLQAQLLPEHCSVVLSHVFAHVRDLPQAFVTMPHATPAHEG